MGCYLQKPITQKITNSGSHNGIEFSMSCMQGWRDEMQDAHICEQEFDKDTQLYAVFDGHSGSEVAEYVSRHFGEELKKNNAYLQKEFDNALKETFLKMDSLLQIKSEREEIAQIRFNDWKNMRKLKYEKEEKERLQFYQEKSNNEQTDLIEFNKWKESQKLKDEEDGKSKLKQFREEQTQAGCTANVTLIYKNQVYVANAGDSRCVLSQDGISVDLSKDHKPDDLIERLRIIKAEGKVEYGRVNGNLNLSRALGDLKFKQNYNLKPEEQQISAMPDIVHHELGERDEFLLIGCDGIWEKKTNQELISICRKNLAENVPMTQIVEDLLDQIIAKDSLESKGCDNMSMILVKIKKNIILL